LFRLRTIILSLFVGQFLGAQTFTAYPRHSFYTDEQTVELLLQYPAQTQATHIKIGNKSYNIVGTKNKSIIVPANEILPQTLLQFYQNSRKIGQSSVSIPKLMPKSGAVRIDRLNGTLQVDGLPFFPIGFYAYSPVQPTLIEEEAVRAFNIISPYQNNKPENFFERIAYLDRAAALGMKVNYHLTALAGGGGVDENGEKLAWESRKNRLRAEVESVKDHPALLSYYLADEPSARNVNTDTLALLYKVVKEADPYHPVTMVFNETEKVHLYANSFDILMIDPYPIPTKPITDVADFLKALNPKFAQQKPIWLVPQTFGGGEWWTREPTRQELKAMVYLGLIHGATGFQAFIRQGLSTYPKSVDVWNEYGRVAREVQTLVPFFTQEEAAESIACNEAALQFNTWQHNGELLIVAVNTENTPLTPIFNLPSSINVYGNAKIPFENREIEVQGNAFTDMIEGFGTKVYRIKIGRSVQKERRLSADNLLVDGGFEAETNPLTPDAVYLESGTERGATAFLDPRTSAEGMKSLRLQTPKEGSGLKVMFYPAALKAGQSYALSIYGKGAGSFKWGIRYQNEASFSLNGVWQKFVFPFRATENYRYNPILSLFSAGTAWFDAAELSPDPKIEKSITEQGQLAIKLSTVFPDAQIWYQLGNGERQPYQAPFTLNQSMPLSVQVWQGQNLLSEAQQNVQVHQAVGKKVTYLTPFNPEYPSSGESALTDANEADTALKNPAWQGFFGDDAAFIVDLGQDTPINQISVSALQDWYSWVLPPKSMSVLGASESGGVPVQLGEVSGTFIPLPSQAQKVALQLRLNETATVRYLQFNIRNQKILPQNHPGAGTKAWLFLDEIVVE
jgi:hypothetical protein